MHSIKKSMYKGQILLGNGCKSQYRDDGTGSAQTNRSINHWPDYAGQENRVRKR